MTKPFLLLSCIHAACVVGIGDAPDPPEPPDGPACSDPRYDDGVCNTNLACDAPDIDCFRTFADDAAATLWYVEREARKAQAEDHPPRALLPPSDPRFVQMRALLDTAWQAFAKARPVGKLVEYRPALVVIEDGEANAFVSAESATQRQVFAVMVQTGLQAAPLPEDARLGVLLHELEHIVGTHGIPGVDEDLRRHYVAAGSEPIGRQQADDPIVHDAIERWLEMADDVGPYSASELGAFPYRGTLWDLLDMLVDGGMRNDPVHCQNAAQLISSLRSALASSRDALGGQLTLDLSQMPVRVRDSLVALRDECMPGVTTSFVESLARLFGTTPADITQSMTDHDLQLVTGKHVVDALATLATDRRTRMRTLEHSVPQSRPWSLARYFSTEEDADDVAVMVLRAAGRDAESYSAAAVSLVAKDGSAAEARCKSLLAAGTVPPYGVDLT
ncbi:MAG TPA: hypothetical protein VFV99_17830, partial [Kofleriaceae bacterium]|nr:hypothetical protein [Kofleriaceae bacterium]